MEADVGVLEAVMYFFGFWYIVIGMFTSGRMSAGGFGPSPPLHISFITGLMWPMFFVYLARRLDEIGKKVEKEDEESGNDQG